MKFVEELKKILSNVYFVKKTNNEIYVFNVEISEPYLKITLNKKEKPLKKTPYILEMLIEDQMKSNNYSFDYLKETVHQIIENFLLYDQNLVWNVKSKKYEWTFPEYLYEEEDSEENEEEYILFDLTKIEKSKKKKK